MRAGRQARPLHHHADLSTQAAACMRQMPGRLAAAAALSRRPSRRWQGHPAPWRRRTALLRSCQTRRDDTAGRQRRVPLGVAQGAPRQQRSCPQPGRAELHRASLQNVHSLPDVKSLPLRVQHGAQLVQPHSLQPTGDAPGAEAQSTLQSRSPLALDSPLDLDSPHAGPPALDLVPQHLGWARMLRRVRLHSRGEIHAARRRGAAFRCGPPQARSRSQRV